MLAEKDISRSLDPVLLAHDVGIVPDDWQADVLRERPKRALLNCSRQSGKTTTALLLTLWTILYEAPALALLVSPSQRQSGESFRSFMQLYQKLDGAPRLTSESVLRCEIENGSRVVALPGSERTVRGFAGAKLILLDEAARIDDELIQALTPMMATVDGSLIALTTPFGRRGWFYETWQDEQQDWKRILVPADKCARLSREFLDSELRNLGAVAFSEEYGVQFRDNAMQMFPSSLIEAAFSDPTVQPLWQ
jgi:hypothetical protein